MGVSSMMFAFLLLLGLCSALPFTFEEVIARGLDSNLTCSANPTSITVSSFYLFTPAVGNSNPSSILFYLDVNTASARVHSTCSSSGNNGHFTNECSDGSTSFVYSQTDNAIAIIKEFKSCSRKRAARITGFISIGKFCYPTEPPMPQGFGTQCQIPGSSASGSFDPTTIFYYDN